MRTVNPFRQNLLLKAKLISLKSSFSTWILKLWQKYWEETESVTRLLEAGGKNDQATFWEVQELFKVLSQLISYLVLRMSARKSVEGTRFNHQSLQKLMWNRHYTNCRHLKVRLGVPASDRWWLQSFSRIYFFVSVSYNYENKKWMQEEPNGTKTEVPATGDKFKKYHKKLKPILKPGMGQIIWM